MTIFAAHPTAHRTRSRTLAAATMAALLVTAGCGSGEQTPAGSSPSTSPAAESSSVSTPADPQTLAAIDTAFATFFGPGNGENSLDYLQNGEQLTEVVAQQGKSSMAGEASAKVSQATVISPTVAKVTYTIAVGGQPMLDDQPGYAVKQDGTWKVSEYTFCGLIRLKMGKDAPDQCRTATATEPPG